MADGNGSLVHVSTRPGTPEMGQLVLHNGIGRWRRSFGSVEPATLHSIIRQVEQGYLEDWADLAAWMLYTDATVRSVSLTRIAAVAGADFEVIPGRARPGEEQLAQEAADAFREQLEDTADLERIFADLLYANLLGWAGAEHDWMPDGGRWVSRPRWIDPREFKAESGGRWLARDNRERGGDKWVRLADHPGKFILHTPRNISVTDTLSGDLLGVSWSWVFKRWLEKFWLGALDKAGAPWIYGQVPRNATPVTRTERKTGIENMSSGGTAIVERGPEDPEPFGVLDVTDSVKDGYAPAIEHHNAEIVKGILGSTDNVQADHGSNARAESQGQQTMLPRNISDAKRLCGTIDGQWAKPWARFNAGYFGRLPPAPTLKLITQQEEPPKVDELIINARACSVDELRLSRGLEPWGAERGGDRIVQIAVPSQYPSRPASGGEPAAAPFPMTARPARPARQLPLPMTSRATTSPTSSASGVNPIAIALASRSGGRGS